MGNNASQSSNITRQQLQQEQHWAHSFPRTPQRLNQQHKVLPDVTGDVHQILRPTNNGEILYSGGTISGRHQSCLTLSKEDSQNGIYRSTSISSKHPQDYSSHDNPQMRHFLYQQREPMGKPSPQRNLHIPPNLRHPHGRQSQQREMQMKRFGSVPDLRGRDENDYLNRELKENVSKVKKKYKAPAPPTGNVTSNGSSLDSWDTTINRDADTPVRKIRLFKTRAEMKRKPLSPQTVQKSIDNQMQPARSTEINRLKSKPKEPQKQNLNTDSIAVTSRNDRSKKTEGNFRVLLADMQRSKSLPEFQVELREATQKLRTTKFDQMKQEERTLPSVNNMSTPKVKEKNITPKYSNEDSKANKLKTLDPNVCNKEHLKNKMKEIEKSRTKEASQGININKVVNVKKPVNIEALRGRASGKESTPEQSPLQKAREKIEQPSKTFYFGMDETAEPNSFNSNVVDHFALSLQKHNNCILSTQTYSGSDLSSEIDLDDSQLSTNGIALHLRPILPKKQLEIPRFSPAAAWRLLSAFDSNPPPSTVSDEGPVLIEDRIEKLARQPPPLNIPGVGPRSNHDKSGDSGISGDAGPPGFEDNSDPILPTSRNNAQMSTSNCPLNLSWTPQQDLEGEESSSEGGMNNNNKQMYMGTATSVKFSPRSHVFSLSLPRDNHLAAYMEEKARLHSPPNYTNLQRLKRSVSGVLGKLKENQPILSQDPGDNWFLSRSAPNSLNNGFNSLETRLSKYNSNILQEVVENNSPPLVKKSLTTNGGRVMYLPEFEQNTNFDLNKEDTNTGLLYIQQTKMEVVKTQTSTDEECNDSDVNKNRTNYRSSIISKSCENISASLQVKSRFEPENLQDPPRLEEDKWERKPKRFTFQSTVRQIERRRLAEKLSKEAERKEKQRLSELEAMRRVEEEFQRKRAKEKASIRQQLRLFSLEDNVWSSSQPHWEIKDEVPTRSEPDGAVSSSASSPTMDNLTKISDVKQTITEFSHVELKSENFKKAPLQRNSIESKSSPVFKKIISRQGSESSDDARLKAQATQVLSEYRQPRREYKDYRISSRLLDTNDTSYHNDNKQTTVHPQVIYNMPKAHGHQSSSTDGSSRSNNYRRDFAHGIMLPNKSPEIYPDETQSNIRKHSPRITQNQRSRQGKCIS